MKPAHVFWSLCIAVIVLDQLVKWIVHAVISFGEIIPVIGSRVGFSHVHNTGGAFGFYQGQNAFMILITVLVLCVIVWQLKSIMHVRVTTVLMGLITGGIIGNGIDRVLRGFVIDFIKIGWWPSFNLADSAIVVGVLGMIVFELRRK